MQKRVAKQGNSQMIAGVLTRRTVSVDAFDQTLENSSRATLTKTSETFNIASPILTNLGNWNRPRSRQIITEKFLEQQNCLLIR